MRSWFLVAALAIGVPASVEAECNRVVLYHCCEDSLGHPTADEWRVFDPERGRDSLILRGPIAAMRWDTTFTFLEYEAGDSLYRLDWRAGARARALLALPVLRNRCTAWFNPDSNAWQTLTISGAQSGKPSVELAWWDTARVELWQRRNRSAEWRLSRSWIMEPDEHGPPTCDLWLSDGVQGVAHDPRWTTEYLGAGDPWGGQPVSPPAGEAPLNDDYPDSWYFLATAPGSDTGFAYRIGGGPPYGHYAKEPLYLVNRGTRVARRLWGTAREESEIAMALQIECGRLLFLPGFGFPRLIDGSTGRPLRVFATRTAVWVSRLRP
jgi:hypothetical protein